ncbi:bacteriocin [Companilactobacillus futsaii]|uniref:Bacteriocin n=2 Tax=Companilactobacillus futsaii TaxID=938155 RepID=A0A5B7T745_9LACO|nr:leucocin A/sakacin P family class II bacteriocin [Companilactobacillus futsaii]QCX26001.1 bacteriocin [Companilactobacillus futsaii]
MKKVIDENSLSLISGGKYYGNGVSCGKHTCKVNWGQAWNESVNRWGNSWVNGLTGLRQH